MVKHDVSLINLSTEPLKLKVTFHYVIHTLNQLNYFTQQVRSDVTVENKSKSSVTDGHRVTGARLLTMIIKFDACNVFFVSDNSLDH